jgi:E3 ubiquitin-protein ligase UHRF1
MNGYDDDVDSGVSYSYTGSGGRDLSGNKRTAMQSSDHTLDRTNEAIAWSCMVRPVSDQSGEAVERWKEGKP